MPVIEAHDPYTASRITSFRSESRQIVVVHKDQALFWHFACDLVQITRIDSGFYAFTRIRPIRCLAPFIASSQLFRALRQLNWTSCMPPRSGRTLNHATLSDRRLLCAILAFCTLGHPISPFRVSSQPNLVIPCLNQVIRV